MTREKRAQYILSKLEEIYPKVDIPLTHEDPYTLLIAVLLSAQCTDKRVNQVTQILFPLANTPEAMVKLGLEKVKEIIKPCGLYVAKSRAIIELSKILLEKYGSEVPRTFEELEALPGVGHKTASVVMVQAFHKPAFPVDTHIHRLAKRWGLSEGKNVIATERDLKALFPKEKWAKVHLQMIYYGREFCTARGCDGTKCVICKVVNKNQNSR
ncbi:MAG: endonuclease III [Verrucomicrobia bacterium]|nr:MAG: endonuclease III [Verrucomicrobiota bacterium]